MKFNDIIKQLEVADANPAQTEGRRDVLKSFGAKLAMAAVPFAAASLFSTKASAQSKTSILLSLNHLLTLELILEELYTKVVVDEGGPIPAEEKDNFKRIAANNKAHKQTLITLIEELGGTATTLDPADIDLSGNYGNGGGPFGDINTIDFKNLLVLTQTLCSVAQRSYKGEVTEVLSDNATVRAYMNIHSVKAREASYMRHMRRYWFALDVKPWTTKTNSDTDNPSADAVYAGDAVTTHWGINVVGINGFNVTEENATQAFDEPLDRPASKRIIDRFKKLEP